MGVASQQELSFAIKAINEASKTLKEVQGDLGNLGDQSEKSGGKLSSFASGLGGVASVAGGIVAAGALQKVGGYLSDAVQGAIEDEAATKRLEQALRNVGGAFDENLAKVNDAITAGQEKAYTDDQVRNSFQQLLAATGDVNEALDRQKLAMDLARGAGIDLEAASRMVGKVNDENVQAFKRMGITIADGATEAEALAAVQAKFAGQSDAYAKSTAGQFEQAKIRLAEVQESIGYKLLPIVTKLGLVFLNDVVPAIEKFVNVAGPKISEFMENVRKYWESDGKPAIDNIIAAWEKISPVVLPILELIARETERTAKAVALALGIVVDLLQGDWGGAWDKAKEIASLVMDSIEDRVNMMKEVLVNLAPLIQEAAKAIGSAVIDGIKEGIGAAGGIAEDIGQAVLSAIKAFVNSEVIDRINSALEFHFGFSVAGKDFGVDINPPDIPHLAAGGIVTRPTLALIGEAGPEAVVPLRGGVGGGGFAGTVVHNYITVQGSVWSLDELAYELNRRGLVA